MASAQRVLVAANRGPVSFVTDADGKVVAKRGGGGLVTALTAAMQASGGLWIAAAMTPEDRAVAAAGRTAVPAGGGGYSVRYLAFRPGMYDRYYNAVSNRVLWFLHHFLWDVPRSPNFDEDFRRSWRAYRDVNRAFAAALDEEAASTGRPETGEEPRAAGRGSEGAGPVFLVQDYHLSLVPGMLRDRRPDARINHFSHIPFAGPSYLRILPRDIREELLGGMLGADVVGFHDRAWADNFLASCHQIPEARVDQDGGMVQWRGRTIRIGVYPISIDPEGLRAQAQDEEVARARRRLERWRGDARMILRVDRTDLSKNILRGFYAFEAFLRRNPSWRGRVWFLALLQSSRGDLHEYRQYLKECLRAAGRVNERFERDGWEPIRVVVGDHFPTVLAAYQMYDVLLVNPVFDGMNLVAKEGSLLNERDGVLVLSENAGASTQLGAHALSINPFDVADTTNALRVALTMPAGERSARARGLRSAVEGSTVDLWVRRQLQDLAALPASRATLTDLARSLEIPVGMPLPGGEPSPRRRVRSARGRC